MTAHNTTTQVQKRPRPDDIVEDSTTVDTKRRRKAPNEDPLKPILDKVAQLEEDLYNEMAALEAGAPVAQCFTGQSQTTLAKRNAHVNAIPGFWTFALISSDRGRTVNGDLDMDLLSMIRAVEVTYTDDLYFIEIDCRLNGHAPATTAKVTVTVSHAGVTVVGFEAMRGQHDVSGYFRYFANPGHAEAREFFDKIAFEAYPYAYSHAILGASLGIECGRAAQKSKK
ncbi:hypothetical protein BC828DRAFT_379949 [Blastocladiella britannica]|nr:hypothetical protein BC828DRAFT_379949 [Blastocladiella britannica]